MARARRPITPKSAPERVAFDAGRRAFVFDEVAVARRIDRGIDISFYLKEDEIPVYRRMSPARWRQYWWAGWRSLQERCK